LLISIKNSDKLVNKVMTPQTSSNSQIYSPPAERRTMEFVSTKSVSVIDSLQ